MFSLFCFVFFWKKKGFSAYMKNAFSLPSLLMHDLRGNYILSLNKPGTTSYGLSSLFSYISAKLRNALPDFIRTGPHFVQRLFFLMNIMYLVGICICYVFVMSRRCKLL